LAAASAAHAEGAALRPAGSNYGEDADQVLLSAQRNAPIHSAEQLAAYMASVPGHSPLEPLSAWGRERFVRSLRFNENGLTTFDYQPLVEELTAAQASRLLALFGAARTVHKLPGIRVVSKEDQAAMTPLHGWADGGKASKALLQRLPPSD